MLFSFILHSTIRKWDCYGEYSGGGCGLAGYDEDGGTWELWV